jgi:hypothetical protein
VNELSTDTPFRPSASLDGDHDAMLASLERSAPVRLMATMKDVVVALADEPVAQAVRRADAQRFDFLPVREHRDGPIIGLFRRRDVQSPDAQQVSNVMQPLTGDILIGADAPLLDFVYAADTHPCRLVIDRRGIEGLVTLSDIQRLPVRTVLFGLFIHLEILLTDELRKQLGSDALPFGMLPSDRAKGAAKRWKKAEEADMDRDPFNALHFTDKRMLSVKCCLLGLEADLIEDQLRRIEGDLRTPLAHGKDFAMTEQSALKVVRASQLLRDWIGRIRARPHC